jgi:hypothetical protein
MALCRDQKGLAVLAVEGKVDEPFGPHVLEWRDGSPTKEARLTGLCAQLALDASVVGPLRYQLIHRSVSALIQAKLYHASRATLLVHSFCPRHTGFNDFAQFAGLLGFPPPDINCVVGPRIMGQVELFVGWAADRLPGPAPFDGKSL